MTLQRIEAAIARLEAAAGRPAPSIAAAVQERARLEASNIRLREAIGMSLRQIDGIIARHDAG